MTFVSFRRPLRGSLQARAGLASAWAALTFCPAPTSLRQGRSPSHRAAFPY